MMGYTEVARLKDEATDRARSRGLKPWHPESAEVFATEETFGGEAYIPFLGDYVPAGWFVLYDDQAQPVQWLADTSGSGDPGEPALTVDQLRVALRDHFFTHPSAGYALVEQGQFQGVVQAYLYKGKRAGSHDGHLGGVE